MGASWAGVAAAVAGAEAGKHVCLIERRTYPGADLSATMRPWLSPAQYAELQAAFGEFGVVGNGEVALVPDRFKIALEDRLLAAGVQLLYAVRPIGVRHDGRYRVELAGKGGRHEISAGVVIDATENAVVARRFGGATPAPRGQAWRTLELSSADLAGPWPPEVRVHQGHAAEHGHVLVEHPVPPDEVAARHATVALARRIKELQPGIKITGAAHELHQAPRWQVAPAAS